LALLRIRVYDPDTGIGGSAERFPLTRHSLVVAARAGDAAARRRAHDVVIRAYWKPVYKYIRIRWNAENEDAKDLTQGFFLHAIDAAFFERYNPARARFRTYLRRCLDGFISNARRDASRLKRGGGARHLPLDFETAEGELRHLAVTGDADPEQLFRKEWIRAHFSLAVEALREECAGTGRELQFEVFDRYDVTGPSTGDRPRYADLAVELGIPVTQVTNHLARARHRFRTILLEHLRETSGSEAEYRENARDLLGVDPA
jgi:RNA polymerase sigma factor (sigma-70 family)